MILRAALAVAVGLLASTPIAFAQSDCEPARGGPTPTMFGTVNGERCALAPSVSAGGDYGRVRVAFSPPPAPRAATRQALNASWLRFLGDNRARRAFAVGEILLDRQTVATVPLVEFKLGDASNPGTAAIVSERVSEADRYLTPRFRITRDTLVQVRIKLLYTNADKTQVLSAIGDFMTLAREGGGHGWLLNAYSQDTVRTALSNIETRLNGLRQVAYESQITRDLRFAAGSANQLSVTFQLTSPSERRQEEAAQSLGLLTITLERAPSAFDFASGLLDNGLPNYGLQSPSSLATQQFLSFDIPKPVERPARRPRDASAASSPDAAPANDGPATQAPNTSTTPPSDGAATAPRDRAPAPSSDANSAQNVPATPPRSGPAPAPDTQAAPGQGASEPQRPDATAGERPTPTAVSPAPASSSGASPPSGGQPPPEANRAMETEEQSAAERVAAEMQVELQSLGEYLEREVRRYNELSNPDLTAADFESIGHDLLSVLRRRELNFSVHDQFALYYVVLFDNAVLERAQLRGAPRLRRDLPAFGRYQFEVPELRTGEAP